MWFTAKSFRNSIIKSLFAVLVLGQVLFSQPWKANSSSQNPISAYRTASQLRGQDTLSLLGQWGWGACWKVVVRDNYAFIGNGSLLQVLDISNPVDPQVVGEVQCPGGDVYGLVISGNYAYAYGGFNVIDISDVKHPTVVAFLPIVNVSTITVYGTHAYVGDFFGGIFDVDVSNPARPSVNGASMLTRGEFVSSIVVVDSVIYATSGEGPGVETFDISNPLSPIRLSNIFGARGHLALRGQYLYLAASSLNELLIYDITNRSGPRYVGGTYLNSQPGSIMVRDSMVYVWEGHAGFEAVDVADTSNVFVIAQMPYIYSFPKDQEIGPASGDFSGSVACIASGNGVWMMDVSKMPVLKPISFFHTGGYTELTMTIDSSHHAFLAEMYGGLQILDISDPSSPSALGYYNPSEAVRDVAVANNIAYLMCDSDLVVLDVSNVLTPKVTGRVMFGDTINDSNPYLVFGRMKVVGSTAYVARNSETLYAIDVSDSSSPAITTVVKMSSVPTDIAKRGNYLYVADAEAGIQVFNVSTPREPRESGAINLDVIGGLCVNDKNLFAFTDSGFSEFKFLDSLNLQYIGSCKLPYPYEWTSQIEIANAFAYSCYNAYLATANVADPTGPQLTYLFNNGYGSRSMAVKDNIILLARDGNSLLIMKNDLIAAVNSKLDITGGFELYQNYPNPFNPVTRISYEIPSAGRVVLKVYDILGREVRTLTDEWQEKGNHSAEFSGANLASGVYIYRLATDRKAIAKKMELMK
ncbi:MAG TPA: T9SS type A sorting domain-containing protein [Bacteroidota bacterium]|nr:T9SS type A sorting domain-containing protein [Bacteroidota bacterium]